jgi:hypothetical protein
LFRALGHRPLASLWYAHSLSALGTEILTLALTWLAAERDTGAVALLASIRFAVAMAVSFLAVGWLERQEPLRLLVGTVVLRVMSALLPLPFLLMGAEVYWPALLAAGLVAGSYAAFTPTLLALMPRLARCRDELSSANALFDGVPRLGRLIGPSVGGTLLALIPLGAVLGVSAALYIVSVFAILLAEAAVRAASAGRGPTAGGWAAFLAGARAAVMNRSVTYLIFLDFWVNIYWVIGISVGAAVLIAQHRPVWLGLADASALGAVIGAYGAGNVIGTLILGNMRLRAPVALNRYGAILLGCGFSLIGLSAFLPVDLMLPGMLLGACVAAPGGPMKELGAIAALQKVIPLDAIGPAIRFKTGIGWVGLLIGAVIAEPLIALSGTGAAITLSGVAMMLVGMLGWRVAEVRLEDT